MGRKPVDNKMRFGMRLGAGLAAFTAAAFASSAASALEDWQINFQEAASPVMERITSFNNGIMVLITLITLFVLALLTWVLIRYRAKVNPVPSKTTHNTTIEVLWTIVPVLILVGIAIPSFGLLFDQYDPARVIDDYDPETALNVKVRGNAWNWTYFYLDAEYDIGNDPRAGQYTSLPAGDPNANFEGADPRLLETTLPFVVPVDRVVRLQVTAAASGVLHAFALPAMGVKLDAVPGRITESWFLAEREGIYYGQCSELCGKFHYAMPIELRVVSAEQFEEWAAVAATGDFLGAKALLDGFEAARLEGQVAAR